MSSGSSSPTEMRTRSSGTPAAASCSARELAVRGRPGVDHERADVADVGQVAAELHGLDEPLARGPAARAPRTRRPRPGPAAGTARARSWSGWSGSPAQRHVATRAGRRPATRRPPRAFATWAVHPLRQRLHALEQQERAVRGERGADVAQLLGAQLGEEPVLLEVAPPREPAVGRDRLGHLAGRPLPQSKRPRLDDHAAERGAVPAEELGGRVDHDVGAVLDRPAQVGRGHRGVDDRAGSRRRGRPRRGPRGRRSRRTGWRSPR